MSLLNFMDRLWHGPIVAATDRRHGYQCRLVSQGARFGCVDVTARPRMFGSWTILDVRWRGVSIMRALSVEDLLYLHRELEKQR
jgi:hypothetical protein